MSDDTVLTGLSWNWILLGATVPAAVGLLFALPFWRKLQTIFGNLVGTGVIFGAGFALIMREYVVIDRLTKACLEAGEMCWPEPSAFTRFAIYAFVALIQVFVLFSVSLNVEERLRRRNYAPEWR
jgi:hypothetical protein